MEQRVIGAMHNFRLNEFGSVLSLIVSDGSRVTERASNIKLGRCQILRWVVDRHFENAFALKLSGEIGDEIENYQRPLRHANCALI
jgi:hypothetical protein